MGTCTATSTYKARKRHVCDACGQAINPGDTYKRYRWFDGGDVGTVKAHPECYEAINDLAAEEGGWVEFGVGDIQRPAVQP